MEKRDQPDDDLHYEDFDDVVLPVDEELTPIDLDALDDEIEPVEQDQATETILEAISGLDDEIVDVTEEKVEPFEESVPEVIEPEPEVIETVTEVVEPEVTEPESPGVEIVSEAVEATPEEPELVEKEPPKKRRRKAKVEAEVEVEPVPEAAPQESAADVIYRVMIPLPDELAGTVRDLRTLGEISEMPPPGIELAVAFRAADLGPVQEALSTWARNHLPLQLETTAVLAEVIGARQYVAAWMLQPEEELNDAQRDLMRSLEPLINPLPDMPAAFHVRVTIGDHVTPKPFPRLIGKMQQDFEPFVWDAETVSLIQLTQEAASWEPVESFR